MSRELTRHKEDGPARHTEGGQAIGVDLGATTVKAGIVSREGKILANYSIETLADKGPTAVIRQISFTIHQLLNQSKGTDIVGIGIGSPGVVALDGGVVRYPPNFSAWTEVSLGEEIQKEFRMAVDVENDANVAALAEAAFGAGKGEKNFLFVIWGTGVGGGIILNGGIYRGPYGGAGEIGHVTIDYNGPPCGCGSYGCIEAYVGQRYLSQRTRDRLKPLLEVAERNRSKKPVSKIVDLVNGNLDLIEPRVISMAAQQGDPLAHEMLEEAGKLLGIGIASVLNVLDLRLVIIGGGISAADEFVFKAIERSIHSRVLKSSKGKIRVAPAQLGNMAGILGAASLVWMHEGEEYVERPG